MAKIIVGGTGKIGRTLTKKIRYDNVLYLKHDPFMAENIRDFFRDLENKNPDYNIIINDVHLKIEGIAIQYSKIKR